MTSATEKQDADGTLRRQFLVHYAGWNKKCVLHAPQHRSPPRGRWDEWVPVDRTLERSERNMRMYEDVAKEKCASNGCCGT